MVNVKAEGGIRQVESTSHETKHWHEVEGLSNECLEVVKQLVSLTSPLLAEYTNSPLVRLAYLKD